VLLTHIAVKRRFTSHVGGKILNVLSRRYDCRAVRLADSDIGDFRRVVGLLVLKYQKAKLLHARVGLYTGPQRGFSVARPVILKLHLAAQGLNDGGLLRVIWFFGLGSGWRLGEEPRREEQQEY